MTDKIFSELLTRIRALPVVDTHEHFMPEQFWQPEQLDFFSLLVPYVCDTLQTAGMSGEEWAMLCDGSRSIAQRFEIFARYVPLIRFTTSFTVLDRTLRGRYGLREYTAQEAERILPAIQKDFSPQALSQFQQEYNIQSILTFLPFDCHHILGNSSMTAVPTVSDIQFKSRKTLTQLEEVTKCPIHSFDGLLQAIDRLFEDYHAAGIRAVKFGSAYRRRLDYRLTTRAQAEQCFVAYLREKPYGDTVTCGAVPGGAGEEQLRPLDDYLAFYMVGKAEQYGMKVFFHCGLHAWNQNDPGAAQVGGLRELISLHPNVSFTLLHCGYPYIEDALLLARYYPNVWLNLTWIHILDRVKTVELIRRILQLLPINKIEGFGGDYGCPALSAAHLEIAQENLALAFADCVHDGIMTIEEAEEVARAWLWDNPAAHYDIAEPVNG